MQNPKDLVLADAIAQAIESSRRIIQYKRIIRGLIISNILTLIVIVVLICV